MLQKEVLVAPLLVARIAFCAERRQRRLAGAVEVPRIFLEAVVGREVHAAAEPPEVARGEAAHVHVHGRAIGIARVQDQRHAHGFVGEAAELRTRGGGRRRQARALYPRVVHAAALEERAVLDQARDAAAALGTRPGVAAEGAPVQLLERGDDARLQSGEVLADRVERHFFGARDPLASREAERPLSPRGAECSRASRKARCPMSLRNCMPSKRMRPTAS